MHRIPLGIGFVRFHAPIFSTALLSFFVALILVPASHNVWP